MRALASPASCKGVLSAVEGAMALAAGMHGAGLDADELPVADGGEGTAEVFAATLGGEWREAAATDPLGRPVRARFLVLGDGSGVVEAAEAIGLRLLSENELDPMTASSRGLGELLVSVAEETSGTILVGLGDTATVDGGDGLLQVVGDSLTRRDLHVLCDVRNPLLGERGAARAFGPQKGASPAQVEVLEARLASMGVAPALRGASGSGRRRRARRRARLARREARVGCERRPRAHRLPLAGGRSGPRGHGGGDDRPLERRGQGGRRGAARLPRAGRPLRALRRACGGAAAGHHHAPA